MPQEIDAEKRRIEESRKGTRNWRRWGPYLSERQWGTVREDYSGDGTAWDYFPHDHARSRAYRWGEDGIAGFSDERQLLCLSLALWNGRDPILKERLFGLTNQQGNHGEDVKELYYYLDAVPSHAYNRMLYKLLQAAYPYQWLIDENAHRKGSSQREFELIDTGLFDEDRYFDVEVEYAKAAPDDILMRITVHNRGPATAPIHILPQAWFRNIWSWSDDYSRPEMSAQTPESFKATTTASAASRLASRRRIGSPSATTTRISPRCSEALGYPATARTGSTISSSKDGTMPSIRTAEEPRLLESIIARLLPARARWCACGFVPMMPMHQTSRVSTHWCNSAGRRRTHSTRCCSRTSKMTIFGSCSARPSPGCCGASSSTGSTSRNGWMAIRDNRLLRPDASMAATAPGAISMRPTSSRCQTSGNTLGSLPGISRSIASACHWSIRNSPSDSCCCSARPG